MFWKDTGLRERNTFLQYLPEPRIRIFDGFLTRPNTIRDLSLFSDETDLDKASNIRTVGYISDEDMKGLMRHAQAFLFPSIYEGFGIPPLEALSVGTKAVVGRASCLPEIYGDTVYYIDPWDASVDLPALLAKKVVPPAQVLTKYSWAKTANKILSEILRTEGISK